MNISQLKNGPNTIMGIKTVYIDLINLSSLTSTFSLHCVASNFRNISEPVRLTPRYKIWLPTSKNWKKNVLTCHCNWSCDSCSLNMYLDVVLIVGGLVGGLRRTTRTDQIVFGTQIKLDLTFGATLEIFIWLFNFTYYIVEMTDGLVCLKYFKQMLF